MVKITVEELDIIVQASVEQALTEFKKMVPQIKSSIKQVEENLNNVETKGMVKKVQQAVQQVKQKVNEVKNTGIDKQLQSQFDKAGASVEKYQGQLDQLKEKLRQVYAEMDTRQNQKWQEYTPDGLDINKNPKVAQAIEPVVNDALASDKNYQNLSREASKLEQQIQSLNSKLNTTKQEYSQIASQIQEASAKQGIWGNAVNKVRSIIDNVKKNIKGAKDNFEGMSTITEKVRSGCSQILSVTTKVTSRIKQMGTGFKQGLTHVLKYAGALFSLQSIYSGLSNTANAWLSSQNAGAQQLSANIDYMKYAMGSALAPVIQTVINLIYQLMKAIQSVVYALTGINVFANASAKAYSNMASSAKKAAKETKQLAGVHDEINNIQETNPESGGGGGSVGPNFDLSQIDSQMSPLAQKLYDFFKPLKESWDKYGPELVAQIKTTASQVGYLISSVWDSFEKIITNGTVYSILENILAIIGNIAQTWANAWNYNNNGDVIVQNLANAFNNLLIAINNVVSSPQFQEWLNNCSDKFREISEKIASIDWQPLIDALFEIGTTVGTIALNILNGLVAIFKWLVENPIVAEIILSIAAAITVVSTAISVISTAYGIWTAATTALATASSILGISVSWLVAIIVAIVAAIALVVLAIMNWDAVTQAIANTWEWIKQKAQEIWTAISEFFQNVWQGICDIAVTIWTAIKDFFVSIWTAISDFFSNIWNGIKETAMNIWNAITTTISNVINGIKNTIQNVLNTISTIWNNIWNGLKTTVTNIFNGIWNAIKGVINSILGGIEKMANGVINGINWIIRALNNLHFDVPDWVPGLGGKKFGFNISQLSTISLPRLAKGAVLKVPTVAEMAEYPGASQNPEIVTPQNIMRETMEDIFSQYLGNNNNNQPIRVQIYWGTRNVVDEIIDGINEKTRRTGRAQIKVSYN